MGSQAGGPSKVRKADVRASVGGQGPRVTVALEKQEGLTQSDVVISIGP